MKPYVKPIVWWRKGTMYSNHHIKWFHFFFRFCHSHSIFITNFYNSHSFCLFVSLSLFFSFGQFYRYILQILFIPSFNILLKWQFSFVSLATFSFFRNPLENNVLHRTFYMVLIEKKNKMFIKIGQKLNLSYISFANVID